VPQSFFRTLIFRSKTGRREKIFYPRNVLALFGKQRIRIVKNAPGMVLFVFSLHLYSVGRNQDGLQKGGRR
jgi:hypothetical protein